MKLSTFKNHLNELEQLIFLLPDGKQVPHNFHVTEIGQMNKKFIDCGGTIRNEKSVNIQLWEGSDADHRLTPAKLKSILSLSENKLNLEEGEIEVEYQGESISKFGLEFNGKEFLLKSKNTACLASDNCGNYKTEAVAEVSETGKCCTPGSGCC